MKVYTDHPVTVVTGPPVAPGPSNGPGNAVVFTEGEQVEVLNIPAQVPVLHKYPFTGVCFRDWHPGSRYIRHGIFRNLVAATERVGFHWLKQPVDGARFALPLGEYRMYLNDIQVATLNITTAGQLQSEFVVTTAGLANGYALGRLEGPPGLPAALPFWFHVGAADPDATEVPVITISHDVVHYQSPYSWAMVPKRFTPTPRPLVPRECPPFEPGAVTPQQLYLTNLVPHRKSGIYRPNISHEGVWTTFNKQPYHHNDLTNRFPQFALLDGPRGVGTLMMPTHIQIDRHGNPYCTDPWRDGVRVDATGNITTRCGLRSISPGGHYQIPPALDTAYNNAVNNSQWETAADLAEEIYAHLRLELLGDWSGVPRFYQGFHENWGAAFVKSTLVLDPNAPPIGGEQPHLHGPVRYVASTGNSALYRIEFSPTSTTLPPKVTLVDVIGGPFDVAEADDTVYVTETKAHRISTYKFTRDPNTGQVSETRTGQLPFATPNTEGIFILGEWIYFSERTADRTGEGWIKRWNRVQGGAVQTMANVALDNNSYFIKFAVFPNGAIAYGTWSPTSMGFPTVVLPIGTIWKHRLDGAEFIGGKGGQWETRGYLTAVGVDGSRMVWGNAHDGLCMISLALPSDQTLDKVKYHAGRDEFRDKGYRLIYGEGAYDFQGLPLPWGESENQDYWMTEVQR